MDNRYKVIISNKNLYKEIELTADMEELKVGTGIDCGVRLYKDLFFGRIELTFIRRNGKWSVLCSDNLYLSWGDVRKLMTAELAHGDSLEVKYQDSDNLVFRMEFLIDFESGRRKYERIIDLGAAQSVRIGSGSGCNIILRSQYTVNESLLIYRQNDSLMLQTERTLYGVYHNGKKAEVREEIKSGDFFSVSDYFFYYKNGKIWTEIRGDMGISGLSFNDVPEHKNYPGFSRNTRLKTAVCEDEIEILDPPEKPQKPKNNLFMRIFPSLGILIAAGAMAFMGGTMILFSLISGVIAIITAVMGVREGKKEFKEKSEERIVKYNAYIEKKTAEIEQCRAGEQKSLEEIYVSQDIEKQRLESFSPDLFDRVPEDEDFLCVRLGSGAVESRRPVKYKKQERLEIEDDLQLMPEQISEAYKYVQGVPVVCDLKTMNALGITGQEQYRFELFKNIIVDLVTRQYFSDVRLFFVVEEKHKDRVHWLRFLPNVYCEQTDTRAIVGDDESKNLIFEYLYKELTVREQNKSYDNHIIVFFYNEYGFKNHPVSKFVENAKDLGVTFVFFGNDRSEIPVGCSALVNILDAQQGVLIDAQDRSRMNVFLYPHISDRQARRVVDILAPVYTEEISLESSLTKSISMFEMMGILTADDIDLGARWKTSHVFRSMAAPVGVSKTGIISLDLHDKAHGPHGLVAGTTGSGKSEILQTYILSMATLFHPYEVGFMIIDFKGGGMVNQFEELPHLLGAITNIDGKAINRSLKSIKAELQKRQRLFADAEVNHIDKYIRKYQAGEVEEPLPHLIIIVDEFAELKAEQPEFMKELISAARIGRSLGVHLILATQKPAGQVNEQIWSNSRFKLCLKVQSREDSNEVLKSPLAAEIKEPGRAYLQVGNNEIFELFQSAYSGAPAVSDSGNVREFTIWQVPDAGKKTPVYVQKKDKSGRGSLTQLDAIVKYVHDYCEKVHLDKLPDICLPALSEHIDFALQETAAAGDGGFYADLGIYDDPDNQYQGVYSVDVGSQNTIIIGSAQTGKTNILQNIIRSLSSRYTPEEVSIYVLDFASMVLKNFDSLNHVGGVVCASEDEKLKNLFKLLRTEMEERKERLISVGVSSFTAYREAGRTDLPQIVLIIDNLTALKELYFQDDDELLNLCREGITVGISIVIANAQTAGIGYKYLSNFSVRIATFCNDSSEYGALFEHCSQRLDNIPGRCFVEIEKRHLECQCYLAFPGEKEFERAQKIREYIAQTNASCGSMAAVRIPLIPAVLNEQYMRTEFQSMMRQRFAVAAGLDYETVMPHVLDLASIGVLAITGREGAGRHNWMRYMIDMLDTMYPEQMKLYISDSIGKRLAALKDKKYTCGYSILTDDALRFVKEIEEQLKERYDALAAGDDEVLAKSPLLMLVIDSYDAAVAVCNDREAMEAYKNITGRYKNLNVCIIISAVENVPIPYSAPEIFKNIRDQHHMMYFDDISNMKIYDMPLAVARKFKKPIETGDGYYIKDNECMKLKTPLAAPDQTAGQ